MELEIGHLIRRYVTLRVMDPGRVSRLAASLAREGQRAPVVVVAGGVLVDGYHRAAALEEIGRDLVTAVELPVSEAEALVLTWRLETGRRKSALEDGWLLAELAEAHHQSLAELGAELRRSKSWVSERLGLVRALPPAVQDAVRTSRIPANGAAKSLVPMARADREACERMVGALDGSVTVRQLERLYAAWRKADPEGRARLVERPMLFLKTEEVTASVPLDAEERLARDFERIAGLCRRGRQQLCEGAFPRGNSVANRTWRQAAEAFRLLEEEVGRARSRDA